MLDICKLTVALVFAAIAGLTAMAAGLMSDVRISVILMRTGGIFLVTGILVYMGASLFERLGYGSLIKDTEGALADIKTQEQIAAMKEDIQNEAEQMPPGNEEQAAEESAAQDNGFAPLNTDSLRRVTGSTEG